MLKRIAQITITLLILLPLLPSHAGIYKWTDASGKVHYSDRAPATEKAQALNPKTALPDGALDARKQLNQQESEFQKNRAERLKQEGLAKKEAEKEALRKKQCAQLRKNLQTYLTKKRVTQTVDGKPSVINYEDRLKKMEAVQKQIQKTCQ